MAKARFAFFPSLNRRSYSTYSTLRTNRELRAHEDKVYLHSVPLHFEIKLQSAVFRVEKHAVDFGRAKGEKKIQFIFNPFKGFLSFLVLVFPPLLFRPTKHVMMNVRFPFSHSLHGGAFDVNAEKKLS